MRDGGNEERLKVLVLTNLETRIKRGDLLLIYKIKQGFEKVEFDMRNMVENEGPGRRNNTHEKNKGYQCEIVSY